MNNSFGLGLILSFVDNATPGMRKATQTFEQMNGTSSQLTTSFDSTTSSIMSLTSAGMSLSILGNSLSQSGKTLLSVVGGFAKELATTGNSVNNTRITLNKLFGSVAEGEQAFNWVKGYAKSSVFEFKDLIEAMTTMKAVGIDARQSITTAGGATQNLLDYASDLGTAFPNMVNAYGTGVQAAMGAIKEYIAEGNEITFKRGTGLDITGILGEDKGGSIKERTQQIADLVEKQKLLGLTMAKMGTPTMMMSNMHDMLFTTMVSILDSGVYEKYTSLIKKLFDYLMAIPQNEIDLIAKNIGKSLISLMGIFDKAIKVAIKLFDWLRAVFKEHPMITKVIIALTTLSGIAMLTAGSLMKTTGTLFFFIAGAYQLIKIIKESNLVMGLFSGATKLLKGRLLPLSILIASLYIVWKKNVFGIRDITKRAVKDISTTLSLLRDAFPDFTMTEENFEKARKLGLLPFIESILLLKYYTIEFARSFKKGFNSVFDSINKVGKKIGDLKISIFGMTVHLGKFFKLFTKKDMLDNWKELGKVLGSAVAILLIIIPVVKTLGKLFKVFKWVFKVGKFIVDIVKKIGPLFKIIKDIFSVVKWFGTAFVEWLIPAITGFATTAMECLGIIAAALDVPVAIVVGIIALVIALIVVVIKFRKQIAYFFTHFGQIMGNLGKKIWNGILGLGQKFMKFLSRFPILMKIIKGIGAVIKFVIKFYTVVFTIIWSIIKFAGMIYAGIFKILFKIFMVVVKIFGWIFKIAGKVFKLIWTYIKLYILQKILMIKTRILWLYNNILKPIGQGIKRLLNAIGTRIAHVYNKYAKPYVDKAKKIIKGVTTTIKKEVAKWIDKFTKFWEKAKDVFEKLKKKVISVFETITKPIKKFFGMCSDGISKLGDAIDKLGGKISGGIDKQNNKAKKKEAKTKKAVGLSTGGYVNKEGMALLHPNEVVVNDRLTRKLGMFLDDYSVRNNSVNGAKPTVVVNNVSASVTKKVRPLKSLNPSSASASAQTPSSSTNDQYDYSVTFMAGSIVLKVDGNSDTDLEKTAMKIKKIIERAQDKEKMSKRSKAKVR